MKKLLKQTTKISALILGIFFLGCSSDDGGTTNLPAVVAEFSFTLNTDTGTATFTNTSTNATTYSWNFGDGNTSTDKNPVKNFGNGTFTVTLTASNSAGASDTFEDSITVALPEEGAMVMLPITFDDDSVDYTVTTFEGATFAIVANPDVSGTNDKASNVGSITNGGFEFEGIYFDLGSDIDLTTNKTVTMNFWADAAVDVLVKLEEGSGNDLEATSSHSGSGWETLLFDFSSSEGYSRLTLFVDGAGTSTGTFYIDDIDQIATIDGGNGACALESEQSLSAADFNLTFQTDPTASIGSFDAGLTWKDNPDIDNDVNSSCKVGQIDRIGSALFANNQIALDAKLDLSANAGFKMKVWSPNAETNVLLKLEDQADAGSFAEVSVATTKVGEWEELTFPFANSDSGKFDLMIIFFELNTETTETYYIDDLALYAREGGNGGEGTDEDNLIANGGFETGDGSGWDLSGAANNGTFEVNAEAARCDDFGASLGADVDASGGGATLQVIRQANMGIGTVTPNSDITISFDLKGSLAGAGGVFFAEFFSEGAAGVSKTEILGGAPLSPSDTWVRYSFTTTTGDDVASGVTLQLKSECGPVGGCAVEAFIDNVYVALGPDSGPACNGSDTGTGGGDTGGGDTGGGTGVGDEFTVNGDFETGDVSSWTLFVDTVGASFEATSAEANGGTFSGRLLADFEAGTGGPVDAVVKQANLLVGTATPNTAYVVSFDLKGTATTGGVFFAEFFSELSGGGTSKAEILSGGPLLPTSTWTTYTYTVTTGADVSGGITLQLKSSCGPVAGCIVDAFIDNVSIKLAE